MKKFIALVIFGIAFGLLEAIVVFYIHTINGQRVLPHDHYSVLLNLGFIAFVTFSEPLIKNAHITSVEMWREFTTIVMLATLAYAAGDTIKKRIGAFLITFALWDIFYYIFLHFLIGWPTSLFNIDIYFLLPVPWVGPVITPIVISDVMIIIGTRLFLLKPTKK